MELRDYQKQDVQFYKDHHACCNFSEQRTGKTPPVCVYIKEDNIDRVLIVCPKSMVFVWAQEMLQWAGICPSIITSTDYKPTDEDRVLIVNFDKLRGSKKGTPLLDSVTSWSPELLVVDEAHRCKDWKSLTFKAVDRLSRKSPRRIFLTGTPATNNPWDVWSILHFVDRTTWSSVYKFLDTCFTKQIIYLGHRTVEQPGHWKPGAEAMVQNSLSLFTIQHKRAEVMPWLTDASTTKIKLPMTALQKTAVTELELYFEFKHIITQNILENLIRVRQILDTPHILGLKGKSPKLEWLKEYISDYPEKTALVCSQSKKFIDFISAQTGWQKFTGDTPVKERQELINAVQSGKCKVLLAQTQAIKEGLTLDEVDVTIFLDVYPPCSDYLQARDRMVATSVERNKAKEIIQVMMEDSYDEQLFDLIEKKIDETDVINSYRQYVEERRQRNGLQG